MGQLLVRKVDDSLIAVLKRRAAKHGISTEEEHRRVLAQCLQAEMTEEQQEKAFNRSFVAHLLSTEGLDESDEDPCWIFDRHDIRYGQALLPAGEDFKAHLLALGDDGADVDFERPRTYSKRRDIEL